jgi:UDP:flavonoid glycosyltransferase YjiC (YdhE family)
MVPKVEALGFPAFASGTDVGLTPQKVPLIAADIEDEIKAVARGFGRRIARERAADILPLCADWRPDLLVCEEMDFGAMIVAERLQLPYATVLVIASGALIRREAMAVPLNEGRAEYGLPPDPELAMFSRYLVLSPFPPSYRDPGFPLPPTTHVFHAITPKPITDTPTWSTVFPKAPTVYFTLGTVFPLESGDLFVRVITSLQDLPINLVVTVGNEIDPAEFGAQPPHVHIAPYIPQAMILPHCALVVSHGGSGSVMGALAHGLPMVLLPIGADQPLNAARCQSLGIARVLDPMRATSADIRAAVSTVLTTPTYRQAAERLRDEIAAMPEPMEAVRLLEQLGMARRAIYSV